MTAMGIWTAAKTMRKRVNQVMNHSWYLEKYRSYMTTRAEKKKSGSRRPLRCSRMPNRSEVYMKVMVEIRRKIINDQTT